MNKFTFQCVHCFKDIEATENLIGQLMPCIYCEDEIKVPPAKVIIPPTEKEIIEQEEKKRRKVLADKAEKEEIGKNKIFNESQHLNKMSSHKGNKFGLMIVSIIGIISSILYFLLGMNQGTIMGEIAAILCAILSFIILFGYIITSLLMDVSTRLQSINYDIKSPNKDD